MGNSISKNYDEAEGESEQKGSPVKKPQEQEKSKKVTASQNANAAAGGWFGGIFSKLKSKSNQMKLPDDKNPKVSCLFDQHA